MIVLFVHNYYKQPGGEDAGVRQERDLLAAAGHRVIEYSRHSNEIALNGLISRISLAMTAQWSTQTYRELRSILRSERPDVVHVHNTVPFISPAAYFACADVGVRVVQTLHNYRLLCPAGSLLRRGHICEECVEHTLFRSVRHRCYKDSAGASATLALMLATQRALGTWTEKVDCYIARTHFARRKFIEAGLPAEKIVVKPCFVDPDPGPRSEPGETALFVGRLSPEKGLLTLIAAWALLSDRIPLHIAGDGPLRSELEVKIEQLGIRDVRMLGHLGHSDIVAEMKRARFLVFPSEWYEGLPLTIAEAFSCGVPVIASRIGSMIELVEDGRTGLHFNPGDPVDLAAQIEVAWAHPEVTREMGLNARAEYEIKYTGSQNYRMLMEINQRVNSAVSLGK